MLLKLYVLLMECCEEEECYGSQQSVDHVVGIFGSMEALQKEVKENPCQFPLEGEVWPRFHVDVQELCVSCLTYCHDLQRHMEFDPQHKS